MASGGAKRKRSLKLDKVLKLFKKAVVFPGHVNVGVRYVWRLEIVSMLAGGRKDAKQMLQKFKGVLETPDKLFGLKFQKKLEKDRGKDSSEGLLGMAPKSKKTFQQRYHNQQGNQQQQPFTGGFLSRSGGHEGAVKEDSMAQGTEVAEEKLHTENPFTFPSSQK